MAKKKRGKKAATPKKPTVKKVTKTVPLSKIYDSTSVYTTHTIKNYEISKKFYEEILEFPVNLEIPMAGWYEFRLPVKGALLGLSQYREDSGEFKPSDSLNISITDVEKAKASLESKGISTSDIIDYPDMVSMISFQDPDKNNIWFVGPPRVKSSEK
ncbi:MAG: VOC family protein [Candidatus Hodarchaeales archaeon]|jgi:predicted enzyme related to lactoylglutathione lyase